MSAELKAIAKVIGGEYRPSRRGYSKRDPDIIIWHSKGNPRYNLRKDPSNIKGMLDKYAIIEHCDHSSFSVMKFELATMVHFDKWYKKYKAGSGSYWSVSEGEARAAFLEGIKYQKEGLG